MSTPAPAPALTDEEIDGKVARLIRGVASNQEGAETVAAVIDRAKREERAAIADAARDRYGYQSKIATWIESEATDDETR